MNYFMKTKTNKTNNTNSRFLKIPVDEWKYELDLGEISWEELDVLLWHWMKANPNTGKTSLSYPRLAKELKNRFPYIKKQLPNKLNKIMISLKAQQRLWFKRHSGSNKPTKVELHKFPLINGEYTDISYRFQQNSSRGISRALSKKAKSTAGLSKNKQRLKKQKAQNNKHKISTTALKPSRTPKKERKNKIPDKNKKMKRKISWTTELLEKLEKNLGTKIIIMGPQIGALGRMQKVGADPEAIWKAYEKINKDWQSWGFKQKPDFINLARLFHKYHGKKNEDDNWKYAE